jgi:membrane-associated protease RseP (regulator of RpoE activity)
MWRRTARRRPPGLAAGDEVIAIDGRPVATWLELAEKAALAPADSVHCACARRPATSATCAGTGEAARRHPRAARLDGMDVCQVAAVSPGSGAEAAGLQPGDRIVRFDGQPVYSRAHMSQLVDATAGPPGRDRFFAQRPRAPCPSRPGHDAELERHLIGIQFNTMGDLDFETRVASDAVGAGQEPRGGHLPVPRRADHARHLRRAADAVGGPVPS